MTTTVTRTTTGTGNLVRTSGRVTVAAGLVGAGCAVAVLAWPARVGADHYSYPFDATGYAAAQSVFAGQHVGIVTGLAALAMVAWNRAGRATKAGLVVAIVGMAVLTACEIYAISAAHALVGTPRADAVDNAYSLPMMLIGIGMVVAGTGLARRPVLPGWARWMPLVLGVYVFVPLFPAVFGPPAFGRVAIGVWMLLFSALGIALARVGRDEARL